MEKTIQLENKKNTDFQINSMKAKLVEENYGKPDECFYDIDPGVYHYLVKWVGGKIDPNEQSMSNNSEYNVPLFETRYFHINTSRKYERIGSSPEEKDGCTVCIENANLLPVHAEISLKEAYNYVIFQQAKIDEEEFSK